MAQMRIFVSHSSADNAFCQALVHALQEAGADVWYDDEQLHTGKLLDTLTRELASRDVFLLVLSKAAFQSPWVRDEARWAYNLLRREPQRIILPVIADTIEPSDFNSLLFLEDFKRIEAPNGQVLPVGDAIQTTLETLLLAVGEGESRPSAVRRGALAEELLEHGKSLGVQQLYELALPFFQCAIQLVPESDEAAVLLGFTLNELDEWERSVSVLEPVVERSPDNAAAWANMGYALNRLERFQEGLAACERCLELESTFATAWNNKGWALLHLKRAQEALVAFEQALHLAPTSATYWENKASALTALGRAAEAGQAQAQGDKFKR